MKNNEPTLHYVFEHIVLRDIVLGDNTLFTKVFEIGPHTMHGFLRGIWLDLRARHVQLREKDVELDEKDFSVSLSKLANDEKLLLIKTPSPVETTGTFYLGVTIGSDIRYFTLELGHSEIENKESFVVCEWNNQKQHQNYGKISEPRPGLFAGRIEEILISKKVIN